MAFRDQAFYDFDFNWTGLARERDAVATGQGFEGKGKEWTRFDSPF